MQLDDIKNQLIWTDNWTLNLIEEIKEDQMMLIPEGIGTNINWQMGHIIISKYFHAFAIVWGMEKPFNCEIPLDQYKEIYGYGSKAVESSFNQRKANIVDHFNKVSEAVIESLKLIDDDMLMKPTTLPHPVLKTNLDALTFVFKHQMYHCGQMALIKRILNS